MERYAIIHEKMPREFVLLQGQGCRWRQCIFCDYHEDVSTDPFEVNRPVLEKVTGQYGVLDVINSGSGAELDSKTLELIRQVVQKRHIHTLWFEMHWMYRKQLKAFAAQFPGVEVKFRTGAETFDPVLRTHWKKGIPASVTPEDIAEYFQGVCLLCCTKGENREHILSDIKTADRLFEYFSVNLFCNNHTSCERDEELAGWFVQEVLPEIENNPKIEVLINNTELGVGTKDAGKCDIMDKVR